MDFITKSLYSSDADLLSPSHLEENLLSKAVFSLFLLVENSSGISELIAITRYFYLPVPILVGNANEMRIINFMNSLLTNLIASKIQSWPKFLA